MPESVVLHDNVAPSQRREQWHGDPLPRVPDFRPASDSEGVFAPLDHAGRTRPEGYSLRAEPDRILIAASTDAGRSHAAAHVRALFGRGQLRAGFATDWPALRIRGVIEGFYGEPWSHEERLRMLSELGAWRMNTYVYAPKDDPYHRQLWREAYPTPKAQHLSSLVSAAAASGVDFVYAIHPGLDIRHTNDDDHAALARRAAELAGLGVRRFAVLFDDIPYELSSAADRAVFGQGPEGAGRAQSATLARFAAEALSSLGLTGALLTVPTEYAGTEDSAYRRGFSHNLPDDCAVMWTGRDIVVGDVRATQAIQARAAFGGRDLVLWDNFPVNDFDRSRAFLGPLLGREPDLARSGLAGIVSNPMVEFEPSRFATHTVAQWAWNPDTYMPDAAAEQALHDVAREDAELLRPLVAAASSWPPSAPQYEKLSQATEAALARDGHLDDTVTHLLVGLRGCAALGNSTPLRASLAPWGEAAALTADVIDASLAYRRHETPESTVETAWEAARAARHGIARDVARATAEAALGRSLPDPVKAQADAPEEY